jgi:hypothetical protein
MYLTSLNLVKLIKGEMSNFIESIKKSLRPIKRRLEAFFPRNWRVSPPIAQLFLGGLFVTRYSLVNFPSLFSPKTAHACVYKVALYDRDGFCVGKKKITVGPFGSFEIVPSYIFGEELPDFGMITAKILSASPLFFLDRHLGRITSHIYALFLDKAGNSSVLVHPQTTIGNKVADNVSWKSGVLWDSNNIKKITAFQINPTPYPIESKLFLFSANANKELAKVSHIIPPMGSKMVSWDLEAIGLSNTKFTIGAFGLPTPNAKPIVLTYFDDGTFTGMHS